MSKNRSPGAICIVCSAGGHLTEAVKATSDLKVPKYYVTYHQPHVRSVLEGEEVYYVQDPHQKFHLHVKNVFQSLGLFLRKRPRVVVTTGAGIALATCLLVKITGGKLVFIETGARITSPSRTGRFLYPICDLFIIQWDSLKKFYPKAISGGLLL